MRYGAILSSLVQTIHPFSWQVPPREMGTVEAEALLTWLAIEGHVSASTQGQTLAALLFLSTGSLAVAEAAIIA